MTNAEVFTLVHRLERYLLDRPEFHYRDHRTCGRGLSIQSTFHTGVDRMRQALSLDSFPRACSIGVESGSLEARSRNQL